MMLLMISIPLMLLGIAIATIPLVIAMRRQHHDVASHLAAIDAQRTDTDETRLAA